MQPLGFATVSRRPRDLGSGCIRSREAVGTDGEWAQVACAIRVVNAELGAPKTISIRDSNKEARYRVAVVDAPDGLRDEGGDGGLLDF